MQPNNTSIPAEAIFILDDPCYTAYVMASGFTGREQAYYDQLRKLLAVSVPQDELLQTIVDAPFRDPLSATYIELGMIMFWQCDERSKTIHPVTVSNTPQANSALRLFEITLSNITVPLDDSHNVIAQALHSMRRRRVEDWKDLFTPVVSVEAARFYQAGAGAAYAVVSPLHGKIRGALVFYFFSLPKTYDDNKRFIQTYTRLAEEALARELD